MSNPPPIDPPNPSTDPVKTYTASAPPDNWKALEKDQTQPLPTDNTVSLGTLYRRGYCLNAYFHFLYNALKVIRASFSTSSTNSNLRRALIGFVNAFNAGIVSYGNALWKDIEHLLEDGTYGKNLPALKEEFFENLKDPTEGVSAPVVRLWFIVSEALDILLTVQLALSNIRPTLACRSYDDLLMAVGQAVIDSSYYGDTRKARTRNLLVLQSRTKRILPHLLFRLVLFRYQASLQEFRVSKFMERVQTLSRYLSCLSRRVFCPKCETACKIAVEGRRLCSCPSSDSRGAIQIIGKEKK